MAHFRRAAGLPFLLKGTAAVMKPALAATVFFFAVLGYAAIWEAALTR